jgi:hypothetical protein
VKNVNISPSVDSVLVGDAELGDLLIPLGHPENPMLVVEEEGKKYLLCIGKNTTVVRLESHATRTALRILGDWRFRLTSINPKIHGQSPANVESGMIAISPKGRFFISVDGDNQFPHELLVNLDTLEVVPNSGDLNVKSFPTTWVIERLCDGPRNWEVLFDPNAANG